MAAWSGLSGRSLDVPAHRAGQPPSTPKEITMTYPTDRPATGLVTGASRGLGL